MIKKGFFTIIVTLSLFLLGVVASAEDAVCKIGDTEYSSFDTAFDAAKSAGGGIIELVKDATFSSNKDCGNVEITIYGNGFTLTRTSPLRCFTIYNSGILNLGTQNGGEKNKLTLTTKTDGTVNTMFQIGGIKEDPISAPGTVNMYDGVEIKGIITTTGSSSVAHIGNSRSSFNMYGGKITDCKSPRDFGVIAADEGAYFNMYNGEISGCQSYAGGVVYAQDSSKINIYGGTLKNNVVSGYYGGAIFADTNSEVNINGISAVLIEGNSATYGGGIAAFCNIYITGNVTMTRNSATYGGAICHWNYGQLQIDDCNIHHNTATLGGGVAVLNQDGYTASMRMTGGKIHNNSASTRADDVFGQRARIVLSSATNMHEKLGDTRFYIDGWYWDYNVSSGGKQLYRWNHDEAFAGDDSKNWIIGDKVTSTATTALKAAFTAYDQIDIFKTWVDQDNSLGNRPEPLTFILTDALGNPVKLRTYNETDGTWTVGKANAEITLTKSDADSTGNVWTGTIAPLLVGSYDVTKYFLKEEGTGRLYELKEGDPDITFTQDILSNGTTAASGTYKASFTNIYRVAPVTINYVAERKWAGMNPVGNKQLPSPEITVILYADGVEVKRVPISAGTADSVTARFENVPKYNGENAPVTYTIKEEITDSDWVKAGKNEWYRLDGMGKYTGSIVDVTAEAVGNTEDGTDLTGGTITNTYAILQSTVTVELTKLWKDHQNEDGVRPGSIMVGLFKNESDTIPAAQAALTGESTADSWTGTFENLPLYDDSGAVIDYSTYSIKESYDGGTTWIDNGGKHTFTKDGKTYSYDYFVVTK